MFLPQKRKKKEDVSSDTSELEEIGVKQAAKEPAKKGGGHKAFADKMKKTK